MYSLCDHIKHENAERTVVQVGRVYSEYTNFSISLFHSSPCLYSSTINVVCIAIHIDDVAE
jgi:hypothetical protein